MDNKYVINIPKDNVNDEECKLVELSFDNGDKVKKGDSLAIFETSKATFDLDAPRDGYFFTISKIDDILKIGSPFCLIVDTPQIDDEKLKVLKPLEDYNPSNDQSSIVMSKEAASLIEKHSINIEDIGKVGLIKKKDVENFIINKSSKFDYSKIIQSLEISSSKKNIVVVGAGGHAKMIIDIIKTNPEYNLLGVIDIGHVLGSLINPPDSILNIPIIGTHENFNEILERGVDNAVNAVGFINDPTHRKLVFNMLKKDGFKLPNIIHNSALIEPSAEIGIGNHILANSFIGSSSKIKENCIINSGSIITHDVEVKSNVHITPGALIAGNVKISSDTIIGMGSTIHFKVKIGKNVKINNGSNIIGDIADNSIIK